MSKPIVIISSLSPSIFFSVFMVLCVRIQSFTYMQNIQGVTLGLQE